jgi:hypothetical protein
VAAGTAKALTTPVRRIAASAPEAPRAGFGQPQVRFGAPTIYELTRAVIGKGAPGYLPVAVATVGGSQLHDPSPVENLLVRHLERGRC